MENELDDIVSGKIESQVYWLGNILSNDTLTKLNSLEAAYIFYIDRSEITSREEFLHVCCNVIKAPT